MSTTLYWHDYETFGSDPRRDRPAQFAGLRTDEALNEVGEPLVVYCRPAQDLLPHPEACLQTGITPQLADERGIPEPEFIARIHAELAQPKTCGVGYNSVKFDDEVTRHALYRNFYDPYAREWKQGNSRWDLINLARMAYALRPEGLAWPRHDDGKPSFRLEDLAAANGIAHESAHDALSDARVTLGLARLIRERQRRLYDWLFQLRDKRTASEQLNLIAREPVLHASGRYRAETGCTTLVMPLGQESGNKNSILAYDLRRDPAPFMDLGIEDLRGLMFVRNEDLPEGMARLPVNAIRINQCPALAPGNVLDGSIAERIAIDPDACARHREAIAANEDFIRRVTQAYGGREFGPAADVEDALYDGFIDDGDRTLLDRVRAASPQELAETHFDFRDERLPELLFRYRARNWHETLSGDERQRWEEFRRHRLQDGNGEERLTLAGYLERIASLREEHENDPAAQQVLDDLEGWAATLDPSSL